VQLRLERGVTQVDLARLIGSTQRNISHYETAAPPPAHVLVKIAKVLGVSTDELLGVHPAKPVDKPQDDRETRRLWKKFQQVRDLPVKDQRAVIRLINSLVAVKKAS
jgi:transcriptional regulator with XRE-family HTH domain